MLRIAIVLLMFACGSRAREAPLVEPPAAPPTITTVRVGSEHTGTMRGRVLRDGKPVPFFVVARGVDVVPIHSRDGRFQIAGIEPGTKQIIIAGPRFGRTLLSDREVPDSGTLDLGDILVKRGHTIRGRVLRANGQPVTGARVEIVTFRSSDNGPLLALARGDFVTTSDSNGAYQIEDVVIFETFEAGRIRATVGDHASSGYQLVHLDEATPLDLLVVDSGGIEGTSDVDGFLTFKSVSTSSLFEFTDLVGGRFQIEHLIPGDYDVQVHPGEGIASPPIQRVTVRPRRQTTIAITVPSDVVSITVHSHDCNNIELKAPITRSHWNSPVVATQRCTNGTAAIINVAPGRYWLCHAIDCSIVDILPSPAHQVFKF